MRWVPELTVVDGDRRRSHEQPSITQAQATNLCWSLDWLLHWPASWGQHFTILGSISQGKTEVLWQLVRVIHCWEQPGSWQYDLRCNRSCIDPDRLMLHSSEPILTSFLSIPQKKIPPTKSGEMCYFVAVFNSDILVVNLLGS